MTLTLIFTHRFSRFARDIGELTSLYRTVTTHETRFNARKTLYPSGITFLIVNLEQKGTTRFVTASFDIQGIIAEN